MSVISNLTVKLAADTVQFDSVMKNATRGLQQLKQTGVDVFNATRTPVENYEASLNKLAAVYRTGKIDADTYGRAMRQLQTEFRTAQRQASGFHQAMSSVGGSMLGFTTGIGAAVVAANLATDAIKRIGGAAIDAAVHGITLAADFEKAEISFTTLFKSVDKAKQIMGELKTFAALTPFEFPELKDAATKLAAFGVEAKQLTPTLQLLGDLAAGVGGNINELAETYGKARIQGRAYTRDLNEFTNRSIPIWEALANVQHKSMEEVHAMVEAGEIGFPQIQEALISLVSEGGNWNGSLEKQSKSLYGLYSTLKDNVNLALAEFGEHLLKDMDATSALKSLIDLTTTLKDDFAPAMAKSISLSLELASALAKMRPEFELIAALFNGGNEGMAGFNAGLTAIQLKLAQLRGDTETVNKKMAELVEIGTRVMAGKSGSPKSPGLPDIESGGKGAEEKEAERLAAGFEKERAALEATLDAYYQTSAEVRRAKLAAEGYTEAQMDVLGALIDADEKMKEMRQAAKESRDATEKLKSDVDGLTASLQRQIDTWGMSADQVRIFELAQRGATKAQLENASALEEQLKKQKDMRDNEARWARDRERILESIKTPAEKLKEELHDIQFQFDIGNLNEKQKEAAEALANKRFGGQGEVANPRTSENKAIQAGTAEAFSAINRANDKNKSLEKIAGDALVIQRRQEIIQRNQLAAAQNVQVWNN